MAGCFRKLTSYEAKQHFANIALFAKQPGQPGFTALPSRPNGAPDPAISSWAFVMKKHLSTHLLGKHGIGQRKESSVSDRTAAPPDTTQKYECDLCERTFSEKWALNNHKKLHSGEKPYKCAWPSCHYSFLNLSAMKDHYRTHTVNDRSGSQRPDTLTERLQGSPPSVMAARCVRRELHPGGKFCEKSYLCDMCGFAGGTRHALTKHRRQHTGERPFKCKFCNFASTTQSHLSRHKRVHTGEKPYRCPWCDYRYQLIDPPVAGAADGCHQGTDGQRV
ncbi:unnamed protein product [Tetraodon nigroviridis]|uniref:(spotted green pufferfish) hypothetical protein n=1 Tax=Tetraodon nigroviridis TaxID=99883 RepID=Q4RFI0_TETNG|nr:unnamed protein product [Tetraodon nigroviridis]